MAVWFSSYMLPRFGHGRMFGGIVSSGMDVLEELGPGKIIPFLLGGL
jgi:hypothetical protein